MKNLIIVRKPAPVNESALALISAMFYGRIQELEKESGVDLVFSKQAQLKVMEEEIRDFVQLKHYSVFEICVLGEDNDINHPWMLIELRNYIQKIEDDEPNRYRLAINDNWGEYRIYQDSLDSTTFIEIKKNRR